MREAEFNAIYEELTPRQRKVVQAFLAGETDEGIATSLYVEAATVRRHLANICIRLSELTPEQVQELAQQYGIRWSASSEVERLTAMVGGHPYLVQLALYHLHSGEMTLDELLQTAPTQAGIYGNDLRRHWQTLQGHPELMAALKSAICCKQQRFAIEAQTTGVQLEPTLAYKLESMGLVQLRGNEARVSCELYRQYFRNCLL